MPPRRSARVAAVAERATTVLSPLPPSVVLHIFSLLPVDCRLRCAEVCRGWRSVLLERSLWTRLDISVTSDVIGPLDALLRCAGARAGGGLVSLHISRRDVEHATLLEVAAANAGALRELCACVDGDDNDLGFTLDEAEALLLAAPLLRVFATNLCCNAEEDAKSEDEDRTGLQPARRALRNEAPFGPLRVRRLRAGANLRDTDEAGVVAFAADVVAHASLTGLELRRAPLQTPAALDAVVDAALARRMERVTLYRCRFSPASAPALARLLSSDALTTLTCERSYLLDAPAAPVAAALRANATLTSLTLTYSRVFDDADAAAELLGALTGHASLRVLNLSHNYAAEADLAAVGAALGALVAANAPALTELNVSECALGDDGLRALLQALPHNTHLRQLKCPDNGISEVFARDVLLPAVRANASLRRLYATGPRFPNTNGSREAMELVNSRGAE